MDVFIRTTILLCLFFALDFTDGVEENDPRTCVIGAGYSGLAVSRYLKQYGAKHVVYEASAFIGGTWRFDPRVGTDEHGVPLFTSMYKGLRTNTPRQTMEYNGFPLPPGTPSYPSGPCFYNYLMSFAKEFNLMENIQLQSWVTGISWSGDRWAVRYTRSDTRTNHTDSCNHVIIAVGQYIKPVVPKWPGINTFKGNVIHSHDYKDPETYKDRQVLLVGAGPSGLDLALHLVNTTSKLVHSHHLVYNQPAYPKTYIKKPDIKEFTSNGVIFEDETFEEIQDVILCTGYELSYPFLDKSSGLTTSGKFVLPLYNHIVNIRHPTMMFVGNVHKIINRVLDVQAEYAAAVASGKYRLPSQEDMLRAWLKHVHGLRQRNMKIVDVNVVGNNMDQYFANLSSEAKITRTPPVLTDIRDFNAKNRLEDWANYRSYEYQIIDDLHYDRKYNPIPFETCPLVDQNVQANNEEKEAKKYLQNVEYTLKQNIEDTLKVQSMVQSSIMV